MGYAAAVNCNCYKYGLATEPPHKEFVFVDKEDGGVYINTDHIKDEKMRLQWWLEFDEWSVTACSHENMYYADEYLANMSGMAHFRSLVNEFANKGLFLVLNEILPIGNGGILPKELTNNTLQEVLQLKNESTQQINISTEYAYIIEPLIIVLNASLVTGNPVRWL